MGARTKVIQGIWAGVGAIALMARGGDDSGGDTSTGPGITTGGSGDGIDPGDEGGEKLDLGGGTPAGGEDSAGDAGNDDGCKKMRSSSS